MLADAVAKMQPGKAPGPSGVVSEMLNASMKASCAILSKLANTIVAENRITDDWTESFIINLYKGKGYALERGNNRGLKLTEHCMKVLKRVVEKLIRDIVDIYEMMFDLVRGRGTCDAIFILQEKFVD